MAAQRKNSLVNNINRRKRAGKSRPKSRSTVSKQSYQQMQEGWSRSAGKKRTTKKGRGKTGAGKKAAGKTSTRKRAASKKRSSRRAAR